MTGSKPAIVVLGGSFSPVHAGHLAALERGHKLAQRNGFCVVAGFFAVAHDGHVRSKFRQRGESSELAFDAAWRLRMCNAIAESVEWLQPTPRTFGSAKECGAAMAEEFGPNITIITVKGSDAPLLTFRGEPLSSTLVRRKMRTGGVPALRWLVAGRVLPAPVLEVLAELLEASNEDEGCGEGEGEDDEECEDEDVDEGEDEGEDEQTARLTKGERAAIGTSTADICNEGVYTTERGTVVDVTERMQACVDGTTMKLPARAAAISAATEIEVVNEGTLGAARRLHRMGHSVVALNFASARNPGGGFMSGAEAQEENLARNSLLYAALTSEAARPFYHAHNNGERNGGLYSHAVIYSPAVPIIRTEYAGRLLESPWPLSFITAAAPNAGAARKRRVRQQDISAALAERAERVLRVAAGNGHSALVLGAWGCGVFQNDPRMVAGVFCALLRGKYHGAFERVTFGVIGPVTNRSPFEEYFGAGTHALLAPPGVPRAVVMGRTRRSEARKGRRTSQRHFHADHLA